MKIRAIVVAAFAALALIFAPRIASAQTNYASTPLGGRSAVMGNTGVALAVDGAAPFLNPATIVRVEDNKLAFSVNMYSASFANYNNWHAPGPIDASKFGSLSPDNANELQGRADALPSTLCFFFTLKGFGKTIGEDKDAEEHTKRLKGRQKLGICLGVVDRSQADYAALNFKSQSTQLTQGQSFTRNWNRFEVGPTFAFYQSSRLSLGASLHVSYAQYSQYIQSANIGTASNPATVSTYDSSTSARAVDMAAIIGAMFRINRTTHIGLSAQSQLGTIWGSYAANEFSTFNANGGQSSLSLAHGNFAAPVPFRFAAGIGAEWPKLRIEGDLFFYPPNPDAFRSDIHVDNASVLMGASATKSYDFSAKQPANAVVNSAMGVEWAWRPELSLLGGLGTDFTAAQRLNQVNLPALGTFAYERVNHLIASAGFASHGNNAEVLMGAQFQYGWGESYALNSLILPNQFAIIGEHNYTLLFIIGGNADLKALADAVKTVEEVVIEPKKLQEEDRKRAEELKKKASAVDTAAQELAREKKEIEREKKELEREKKEREREQREREREREREMSGAGAAAH